MNKPDIPSMVTLAILLLLIVLAINDVHVFSHVVIAYLAFYAVILLIAVNHSWARFLAAIHAPAAIAYLAVAATI